MLIFFCLARLLDVGGITAGSRTSLYNLVVALHLVELILGC